MHMKRVGFFLLQIPPPKVVKKATPAKAVKNGKAAKKAANNEVESGKQFASLYDVQSVCHSCKLMNRLILLYFFKILCYCSQLYKTECLVF